MAQVILQCGQLNHECQGFIFTLLVRFYPLFYYFFSDIANHSHEAMQQPRQSVSNIAWDNKNKEKGEKNVCAIGLVHGCDWLVREICKKKLK